MAGGRERWGAPCGLHGWWGRGKAARGGEALSGERLAATCQGAERSSDLGGLGQAVMAPLRPCLGHWVTRLGPSPPCLATGVPVLRPWPLSIDSASGDKRRDGKRPSLRPETSRNAVIPGARASEQLWQAWGMLHCPSPTCPLYREARLLLHALPIELAVSGGLASPCFPEVLRTI